MIKRDLHLFLRCLLAASVLTAVFAAVSFGAAVAGMRGVEQVYTPARVAVVDQEDSTLSRMMIRAFAGTDQISALLKLERCDADEAYEGLAAGEFAAVIEMPQNFVNDILGGVENRGRITLSAAAAAHGDVVKSMASFSELFLAAGQYAIFSGETVMSRNEVDAGFRENFLNKVNAQLLSEAMIAGNHYFDITVLDYADTGMSLPAHYAASWLAAVLMLGAVMFDTLYTADRSRAMLLRLRASGVSDGTFLFGKIALPFAFFMIVLLVSLLVLGRWIALEWSILSVFCAVLSMGIVAVTAAAAMIGARRGTPVLLIGTLLGLFLCGGLVPRQMLGRGLLFVGDLTPLGVARGLLAPLMGGSLSSAVLLAAFVWLIACPTIALLRLRAERGGREL